MIKIKIIYNDNFIDTPNLFNEKINILKNKYKNNLDIEKSDDATFDLIIDDVIVYTLDDNFTNKDIPTNVIMEKVDHHIFKIKSLKRRNNNSKFDDIGLIDY